MRCGGCRSRSRGAVSVASTLSSALLLLLAAPVEAGEPVVIDATTQIDFNGPTAIELDGSSAGAGANGLHVSAGGSTIRGFTIHGFTAAAIRLSSAGGNTVGVGGANR